MLIQNQQALSFLSVKQLVKPSEARAVPITLDYGVAGANGAYSLNLQNMQARDFIGTIQALWIDNAANGSVMFINFPVANQTIQFPPNSQGYVNALCVNPAQINFTTVGTPVVQVSLLNYPVTDTIWGVNGSGILISGVLTNAQIKTMFSAPTQIIPPQGAGTITRLSYIAMENQPNGVAYTGGGAFGPCYGGNTAIVSTQTTPATFFTTPTTNEFVSPTGNITGGLLSNGYVNLGLFIAAQTADFATGIGVMRWTAKYDVLGGW